MIRNKIFILLFVLNSNIGFSKDLIYYDYYSSNNHNYKTINKIGQSIDIDKDYKIITKSIKLDDINSSNVNYGIYIQHKDKEYNLVEKKINGLRNYIISPYFSDNNVIGFSEYIENEFRGDFYITKRFYIFNKNIKEVADVRLNYTSISNKNKLSELDQNYIKKISVDMPKKEYKLESLYEQNNPIIWGVSTKKFKPGNKVNNGFKFKIINGKISCQNLKGSILDCNEGIMQFKSIKND